MPFTFEEFKEFYEKHPNQKNPFYYEQFPDESKDKIRVYKKRIKDNGVTNSIVTKTVTKNKNEEGELSSTNPKKPRKKSVESDQPPSSTLDDIIDDPNELLMSTCMRELNKQTPDVRWANILISLLDKTKQLETKSKEEVMVRSKLVKYSSNQLIELRKRLIES